MKHTHIIFLGSEFHLLNKTVGLEKGSENGVEGCKPLNQQITLCISKFSQYFNHYQLYFFSN